MLHTVKKKIYQANHFEQEPLYRFFSCILKSEHFACLKVDLNEERNAEPP